MIIGCDECRADSAGETRMPFSLRETVRKIPRGFLGMLVLVGLCEAYLSTHELKFSRIEAEDWKASAKIAKQSLPPGGILILGDSQVKFGMMPLLMESKLGQPAQCLAVQGGQAPSSYFLLRKALDAGVVPSAIIVDFEPHLLRDGIEHNRRMWPELLDLPDAAELAIEARDSDTFAAITLAHLLTSYRERFEIRDNIMAAFKGETPLMQNWLEMADRNRGMNRGALAMSKSPADRVLHTEIWGNPTPTPWTPDPINDRYVRRLLKLAMDRHIPVYCALMPVLPAVQVKYEQHGMNDRYLAWIRNLQQKFYNLYVLDWRHSNYGHTVFTDELHLDHEGAASITAALGDYLLRSFHGQGVDIRWIKMPDFQADVRQIAIEDSGQSDQLMRVKRKAMIK